MVQMQASMCKGHGLSKLLVLAHLSERDVTENFSILSWANERQNDGSDDGSDKECA